ncbi:hypothetical protein Tcan_13264 [Toxocara canis]|uniref:DNA-directed RNA polymerase III subunit RPC4 n=1 Tax=Toxocara canis TaxID=6265 RepID=A0A0B2VVZ3_TOXCA|nr:hypothetical protein Tcan_13264 [Toxocara canis]
MSHNHEFSPAHRKALESSSRSSMNNRANKHTRADTQTYTSTNRHRKTHRHTCGSTQTHRRTQTWKFANKKVMLGRGRGSSNRGGSSRKPAALPNLAVAGKRENREQPETSGRGSSKNAKRERGRGAGRGGRGRGSGRRDSNKPVFIEQLGIFSSGLNDDGRHDRSKTDDYNEFSVVNFGRGKRFAKSEHELATTEDDIKPTTFESEWLSDEEADEADLADLLKDNFLSDMKRGTVMPLVLPLSEEPQFEGLISRGVKKEEVEIDAEQIESEAALENGIASKKKTSRRRIESDSDSGELEQKPEKTMFEPCKEPIVASSQKVANMLLRLEQEPSDDLLLVQLPSTLMALSNADDDSTQQTTNTTPTVAVKTEGKPPPPMHCLDKFDDGTQLGKLRIRRSGRVELVAGGMPLDVTCGIATRHTESVVLIEKTPERADAEDAKPNILKVKAEPMEPMEENQEPPADNMFVIGKVGSSLVCSHDFAKSIEEKKLERKEKAKLSRAPNEQLELDESDAETKKLLADLRSMELKEKSWAKWTTNYSTSVAEPMELDELSS